MLRVCGGGGQAGPAGTCFADTFIQVAKEIDQEPVRLMKILLMV